MYHEFFDVAFELTGKTIFITPGRFLSKAGQTPKEWMERVLHDPHMKVVRYYPDASTVFATSVEIKGGVAVTYRDTEQNFGEIGLYVEHTELSTILEKVKKFQRIAFSDIVSSQGIYKFSELLFKEVPRAYKIQGKGTASKITSKAFENLSEVFLSHNPTNSHAYIPFIGWESSVRTTKWIKQDYFRPVDSFAFYRVILAEANGSGAIGESLSEPFVCKPMIGHTDTFLSIGSFSNSQEANNCLKYIKTKFARTLLATLKSTQHTSKATWANVPLQDFTPQSDIDWSKPIAEIDQQLYDKYDLTEDERIFIERMIKPME